MQEKLLDGVRIVDLAGEPAAMAGRILADLGADVVHVEPPEGDPLRSVGPFAEIEGRGRVSLRFEAWHAGKRGLACAADDPRLDALLRAADLVIDTPGWPGMLELEPERAPQASWIRVTPFGLDGPRSQWRASDLGVMAATGNMYSTGYPDRAPVRASEPSGYGHVGPEVAYSALTAYASGRPQVVDVSMQEVVMVANMGGALGFRIRGDRGMRRGASIGRTREIWKCKDGFVTFGLRGGPARVPSLRMITELLVQNGIEAPAWTERDWATWNPNETSDEEMRALEEPLIELFANYEMMEIFEMACERNLMVAAANTPKEVYGSRQLQAREMFADVGGVAGLAHRPALVTSFDGQAAPIVAQRGAPSLDSSDLPNWEPRASASVSSSGPAWEGMKLVEFGSGAAGPIAARYFSEQGATVIKVESKSRPDFLRIYALGPGNPHGLEGSPLFNALNVGKRSVTLNLKDAKGIEIARQLMFWADAVLENFAPKAMRGFGLDYASLAPQKPDLVMVSSCINGQTGPYANYPGFGAQGSAISCYNFITGWPDYEPMGPAGTITDSLSPRFGATCIAAGVLYHRRTGRGLHVDVSQVENALYTLAPWLLDYSVNGVITPRMGNRSLRTAPHGAFPCLDEQGPEGVVGDRWITLAVWSDEEWGRLAKLMGVDDPSLADNQARLERVDEVEALVADYTRQHTRAELAERLQAEGIEAVPLQDYGDLFDDPQIAHRKHFVGVTHPVIGETTYERNGFRLSQAPSGYPRPTPTLGEHTEIILEEILGMAAAERKQLAESGALD
ncbi:CoA transferase [Myxococcota bacterium]|nr:CoA transferase [Myxococcota bacterium]